VIQHLSEMMLFLNYRIFSGSAEVLECAMVNVGLAVLYSGRSSSVCNNSNVTLSVENYAILQTDDSLEAARPSSLS